MKFSIAIVLATAATTAAFSPSFAAPKTFALRSTEESTVIDNVVGAEEVVAPVEPPKPVLPMVRHRLTFTATTSTHHLQTLTLELSQKSQALPFMDRPLALDGSMAGDVGFDPLGLAGDSATLLKMREAEIKHARLAMLAAAGWPISELMDKSLAKVFGMQPLVDGADRVPSLLNGGLGKVSPVYWGVIIGLAAAIDLYGMSRKSSDGYTPGDLGFDPLGLYPFSPEDRKEMQLKEIKNGRLAMLAIFGFAVQEATSKVGVIDETPFFFKPITQTLGPYMDHLTNSGYINPN